jgi:hypothetical protein
MPHKRPNGPDFFARHRPLLERSVAATASRDHWTPCPESPSKSVYGEDAAKNGEAAFQDRLGGHFELPGHPGNGAVPATETSPYGFPLDVAYPRVAPDEAVAAAKAAIGPWRDAGPDTRAGVAAEILARLNAASFEIAQEIYTREWFGPVSFVIGTDSTEHSLSVFRETLREHGALTAAVHATSEAVLAAAESAALDAGVHLSENLTGGVFVNQSAAFSDFHGSAANPAASATLSDPAFGTGRFTRLQSRRPVPFEESAHV